MYKTYLYYGSIALCGGVLGYLGLSSVASGELALVSILFALSGLGMVLGAGYEIVASSDTDEATPDDRVVWFVVAMALVGALGVVWAILR